MSAPSKKRTPGGEKLLHAGLLKKTADPPQEHISPFLRYPIHVGKWCTVTVTDGEGKRHSLDVNANSSYDAAHLYLTHVRGNPACGLPIPTTSTLFEVVTDGRIHHVEGARLKTWIAN